MKEQIISTLMIVLLTLFGSVLSITTSTSTSQQEGLNYLDQTTWGGICVEGQNQSPIDIPSKAEMIHSNDIFSIIGDNYNLITNQALTFLHGYKYMVNTKPTNSSLFVMYKDVKYQYDLNEIHFHFKSEHTIQSNYIDIEMHMVHRKNAAYANSLGIDPDEKHQFLVVGVMFRVYPSTNAIDNDFISSLNFDTKNPVMNVDLKPFVNASKSFYYYQGSFTTPPCNEIVHWVVMEQVELISNRQNELIKNWISEKYANGNNRMTYPLNGRDVYYVNPSKRTSNKAEITPNAGEEGIDITVCIGIGFGFIIVTLVIVSGFLKQ